MTEGFGQLTVGQLRESGVQPLVHRTDRFDNASRKSRAPTLTGCDRSFCLTLRWREPDSNHRSRSCERSLGCCRREFRLTLSDGRHLGLATPVSKLKVLRSVWRARASRE